MFTSEYLIFDFDGVLSDSLDSEVEYLIQSSDYPTVSDSGQAINFRSEYLSKPKHSLKNNLTISQKNKSIQNAIQFGKFHTANKVELYCDVVDFLQKIQNKSTAIVSSGCENYIKSTLDTNTSYFDLIFGIQTSLSKQQKIIMICDYWNINICDIVYFTDTLSDIIELSPIISSHQFVACTWGVHDKGDFLQFVPEKNIIDSLSQFLDQKNSLN